MSSTDFTGLGLSIQPVVGVRAFDVDRLGRLTGVTFHDVWTPGENTATCHRDGAYGAMLGSLRLSLGGSSLSSINSIYGYGFDGSRTSKLVDPVPEPKKHDVAGCGCGFYAYYDGSNDYRTDTRVSAVVEGYGETLIGTRGFRAQKARIVALCIPGAPKPKPRGNRLVRWFADHDDVATFTAAMGGTIAVAGLILTIGFLLGGPQAGALISGPLTAMLAIPVAAAWRSTSASSASTTYATTADRLDPDLAAKVRRNYPDTPTFTNFTAMVAAYPPDRPAEPTPDQPDFWTRKAIS